MLLHSCRTPANAVDPTGARANGNYTVAGLVPMWQQNYEPLAGSLGASAAVAALPILVLFYMLGVKRKPTWIAAASALGAAVIIALVVYRMPVQTALASMLYALTPSARQRYGCRSPARRAARGGRAPGTPGQGLRPLDP